jgi:putative DNA primase/helicase
MGNAERLFDTHGTGLRWVPEWGWLVWDTRRWERVHDAVVEHLAGQVVRGIYSEAAAEVDNERRKALASWAQRSEAAGQTGAMIHLARGYLPGKPSDFDQQPLRFNVLNGTLDLKTGVLGPHRQEDYITRLAPVEYDPEAPYPRWKMFLQRIFRGRPELAEYLQAAAGYSLTGLAREQVALMLYGLGDNGKTTFLETQLAVVGDYGAKASFDTFLASDRDGPRNDLAALSGARLVVATESESGRRLNETLLKELTGGDTITARFLHREFFSFRPQFQLWLATNNKPAVQEQTHAFWRRLRLVPFQETITPDEKDTALADKLKGELPGILAWAVEGCRLYLAHGLGTPDVVTEATADYRQSEDPLDEYLSDRCVLDPKAHIPTAELYADYKAWVEARGEKPLTSGWFGRLLVQRGVTPGKGKRPRVYQGVRLRSGSDG